MTLPKVTFTEWEQHYQTHICRADNDGEPAVKCAVHVIADNYCLATVLNPKDEELLRLPIHCHSKDGALQMAKDVAIEFIYWRKR